MYQSFEELDVWKRACALAVRVDETLRESRDFGLRDQMQRSAVSIASNIAEGSEQTPKDFARFLAITRGSAAELRTQAYIAAKVNIIDKEAMHCIVDETQLIGKMLFRLSESLKTKN